MNNMYEYLVKKNTAMKKRASGLADIGNLRDGLLASTRWGGANPNRGAIQAKLEAKQQEALNRVDSIEAIKQYVLAPKYMIGAPAVKKALSLDGAKKKTIKELPKKEETPKKKQTSEKSIFNQLADFASKNKGAAVGGLSSMAVVAPTVYALSKKNKLRNAALYGVLAGILGTGAGAAYDRYVGKDAGPQLLEKLKRI